jgi:hypothetical protein
MNEKIKEAHTIVDSLFAKYANNNYMLLKTINYITQQLPQQLESIDKNHEQRESRIEELTNEQNAFISTFIDKNEYYYIPYTELFFHYDKEHYRIYSEDDILHHILTLITKDKQLMPWKQRTKVYIMKRIKENNLLKSVPESFTIQHVISLLYPAIFSSRTEAKYFLTIVGDNILKKNTELIHFLDTSAKHFIRELQTMSNGFLGASMCHTFKHKYHEHNYQNSRILYINNTVKNESIWRPILLNWTIDILCVACHYSNRFGNSDLFLTNHSNDESLCNSVFYLQQNDPVKIVTRFISEYLQKNPNPKENKPIISSISWKNMQYLWKHFLDSKNLPSVIFQNNLKTILIEKLGDLYKEESDTFIGICSKHLPIIQRFILFWEDTITYQEHEIDNEFEIDEICILFKQWSDKNGEPTSSLNQSQLLDLIVYFYPDVEIENDKYIYKICSSLWDKQLDVQLSIECYLQEYIKINNSVQPGELSTIFRNIMEDNICITDAYKYYCKTNSDLKKPIVSKSYFEKYVCANYYNDT